MKSPKIKGKKKTDRGKTAEKSMKKLKIGF